ncbi:MAG: hypothetical protein KatS3mg121_0622 [Gammaproteobacteria bacterium]|nr:MAG: hypothetical protein KatS3mg121_0622 [Gammaproteobacteria bacterium]
MNEARGPSKLEQLRRMSVVVADTGEIAAIRRHRPEDATTNPSLLLKAAEQEPAYAALIDEAVAWARARGGDRESRLAWAADRLAVAAGIQILSLIPGRVSTEVDARLSFDTEGTIRRAQRLVELYEAQGVSRERVLIKIASTWEGIRAAERLEREGIHCNMTLLFSLVQAAACADAGAFSDLAVRRADPRLVSGADRPRVPGRARPGCAVGAAHLRLLQAPRLSRRS